ncbi:acyl-CoA dehydrogenase family protein [Thalassococcus sp. BH17M4-6]|uniref:acyl-CoA dehydrogenase family protein n=1 Tax=Thalassococcus sp. BH17M4-6 TaxID=3413148 RepID=UPI003BD170C8
MTYPFQSFDKADAAPLAEEKAQFADSVKRFIDTEIRPNHQTWDAAGQTPKEVWQKAGKAGLLCPDVPEEYGGLGLKDFDFNLMLAMAIAHSNLPGADICTHADMVVPYLSYFGNPDQKSQWLPKMVAGDFVGCIALTEPGAGSDILSLKSRAWKTDGGWVLNGEKTYISGASVADFFLVAARSRKDIPMALSLYLVERDRPGVTVSDPLPKIGMHAQDIASIYFDDVELPPENLIGRENACLGYVMEVMRRERVIIGAQSLAAVTGMLEDTVDYCKARRIRDQRILDFQNTRFVLARLQAQRDVAQAYLDQIKHGVIPRRITDYQSALIKYMASELQADAANKCFQLHGGAGYMKGTAMADRFLAARASTILGGASEVMLEILGTGLDRHAD